MELFGVSCCVPLGDTALEPATSCVSNQRDSQALWTRIYRNANDFRAFTEARFGQGNYLWPSKGQVSWLDGGLPHLRDRRVCCVRDTRQSIAMCTSVIVKIKAVPASTIQEVEELARELSPANAIVPH